MYSTCLFCNHALGSNEIIEAFPVGSRLAFDQRRGRLWVVCQTCERWNLTPLEERWDAIENCERLFRDTHKRVSTEHIGLARLSEGLELVRIGEPLRPEFAAWRYGDQFGRRHRRAVIGVAATVTMVVGMSLIGLAGTAIGGTAAVVGTAVSAAIQWGQLFRLGRRRRRPITRVTVPGGDRVMLRGGDFVHLRIPPGNPERWLVRVNFAGGRYSVEGAMGLHAMSSLLPHLNYEAGTDAEVRSAVNLLEDAGGPEPLLHWVASRPADQEPWVWNRWSRSPVGLHHLPVETRLALEMAVNEEREREALEGELALLELAWKDAEEIAAIADELVASNDADLMFARLRESALQTGHATNRGF
jgi:hypothetical protein